MMYRCVRAWLRVSVYILSSTTLGGKWLQLFGRFHESILGYGMCFKKIVLIAPDAYQTCGLKDRKRLFFYVCFES